MTDNISKREKLYNNLISTGKVTEQELGTKDDFMQSITDKESASYLYNNLKTKFDEEEIQTPDKFWEYLSADFGEQPQGQVNAFSQQQPQESGLAPVSLNSSIMSEQEKPALESPFQQQKPLAPMSFANQAQQGTVQQTEPAEYTLEDIDKQLKNLKTADGGLIEYYKQVKTKADPDYGKLAGYGREGKAMNLLSVLTKTKLTKEEQEFYTKNKEAGEQLIDKENALLLQKEFLRLKQNLEKYDSKDSGLKTFWKGLTQTGLLEDFITVGQNELRRNKDIIAVSQKAIADPEKLTQEESNLFRLYQEWDAASKQKTDFWFTAGQSSQAMGEFILNMIGANIAAGGLRAGVKTAIGVATKEMLKSATKKAVVKNIGKKLGEAAIFNVMAIPARTTFWKELTGKAIDGYEVTNDGKVVNEGTLGGDLYEASVRTFMEYFAEEFSTAVAGGHATKLLESKGTKKLLGKTFEKLSKLTNNKTFKQTSKALDYANIGNVPEEMFEEVLTQAGNGLFLWSKEDISQLADPDFYKSIAVSVIALQGAVTGAQLSLGGVGNMIDKNRINIQANRSTANLKELSLNITDESLKKQIASLVENIQEGRFADKEGAVENGGVAYWLNQINPLIPETEQGQQISAAIGKAITDNAKKFGVYEGITAMAEEAIGGQFTHSKSPDTVVFAQSGDNMYYVLDQTESEEGSNIMIVRDINTGETKSLNSLEVEDVSFMPKQEFLDNWLLTKDVLEEQQAQAQVAEQETLPEEVLPETIVLGETYMLAGHPVRVVDITEEGIGVEDEGGNSHIVEAEELSEVIAQQNEQQPQVEEGTLIEQQPEQAEQIEPEVETAEQVVEEPLQTEEQQQAPVIEFPKDKQGNIDYSKITEPQMYAQALQEEFADDAPQVVTELISAQQSLLNKAKNTQNVIERKRKEKAINTELKRLYAIKDFINPPKQKQSAPVAVEQQQPTAQTAEVIQPEVTEEQQQAPQEAPQTKYEPMKVAPPTQEEQRNRLVDQVKSYNGLTQAKKRKENIAGMNRKANELGFVLQIDRSGNYSLQDKQGKVVRKIAQKVAKEDIEKHKAITDYSPELVEVMNRFINNPISLEGITGLNKAQTEQALKNIQEGKKTVASNAMLDALEGIITFGSVDIIDRATGAEANIPLEEYLALYDEPTQQAILDETETLLEDMPEEVFLGTVSDMPAEVFVGPYEDMPEDIFNSENNNVNLQSNDTRGEEVDSIKEPDTLAPNQVQREGTALLNTDNTGIGEGIGERVQTESPRKTAQSAAIEQLTRDRETAVEDRNRLLRIGADRVGLFGDTKQDPNDLFKGEGYDPAALQPQIDRQNQIVEEVDRKIDVLKRNEAAGIEEAKGQQSIEDKLAEEEAKVNLNPTEGQKEAGNYKKGHITIQGFELTIENPKGSQRSGVDESGNKWSQTLNNTYGYILGTNGKDGGHIDVFLGDNLESDQVFVIDQINKDKSFDEHKVMLGFNTIIEAEQAYLSNYEDGWQGLGNITQVPIEDFRKWTESGTRKIKPFAEYKQVKDQPKEEVKEYKYKLLYRPFGLGTYPTEGFVRYEEDKDQSQGRSFGTVVYNSPLNQDAIKSFELEPVINLDEYVGREIVYYKDGDTEYKADVRITGYRNRQFIQLDKKDKTGRVLEKETLNIPEFVAKIDSGEYYSSWNKNGAIPGFMFKAAENRSEFVSKAFGNTDEALDTQTDEQGNEILYRTIGEQGVFNQSEEAIIRLDNLKVAREMEAQNKSPKQIKLATGWERGKDTRWRYEVEDDIIIKSIPSLEFPPKLYKFDEVFESKTLFKQYPQIKDVKVMFIDNPDSNSFGAFTPEANLLELNINEGLLQGILRGLHRSTTRMEASENRGNDKNRNDYADVLGQSVVHEVQHIIQMYEGFAQGSRTRDIQTLYPELVVERLRNNERMGEPKDDESVFGSSGTREARDIYFKTAGEVEARNVARRLDMPLQERLNTLLSETEDVSREDQIILGEQLNSGLRFRGSYFYSPTEQALNSIKQEKAAPEQWKAMLLKNGAKQAEMDWMDFDGFVEGKKSITKSEIQEWINQNRIEVQEVVNYQSNTKTDRVFIEEDSNGNFSVLVDGAIEEENIPTRTRAQNIADKLSEQLEIQKDNTKYSQYQEPGGENYKELLLTMPRVEKPFDKKISLDNGKYYIDGLIIPFNTEAEAIEYNNRVYGGQIDKNSGNFKSSHFDEPNILAHIRFNERVIQSKGAEQFNIDYDNWVNNGKVGEMPTDNNYGKDEKVLFIEEIQSDWAQKGKKEGFERNFKKSPEYIDIEKKVNTLKEKLKNTDKALNNAVEDAQKMGLPQGASSGQWASFENGTFKTSLVYRLEEQETKVRNNRDYNEIQEELSRISKEQIAIGKQRNQLIKTRDHLLQQLALGTAELKREYKNITEGVVPDMPFKNTDQWVNLALRRMMTYAAENGFDRIAWTNGEMQAARYDLSKQVDKVLYDKITENEWGKAASDVNKAIKDRLPKSEIDKLRDIRDGLKDKQNTKGKETGRYNIKILGKGGSLIYDESNKTSSEIEDVIGKELTQRIVESPKKTGSFSGLDLKVFGTGMKAFYDNIIPAQANKIGKKFGAKVSSIDIVFDKSEYEDLGGGNVVNMETGEPGSGVEKLSNKTASVQSIPITQGIKEQAQIGMPLFAILGEKGAKSLDIANNSEAIVNNLIVAKKLKENGKDAKTTRLATGWELGKDNKWRYEIIDDIKLKQLPTVEGNVPKITNFGEIIESESLFAAYPEIKDVRVIVENVPSKNSFGSYIEQTNTLTINASKTLYQGNVHPLHGGVLAANRGDQGGVDYANVLGQSLVHEIQHIIQSYEGFTRGSSTRDLLSSYSQLIRSGLVGNEGLENRAINENELDRIREASAKRVYQKLSGEVEARNAERRINLSAEERLSTLLSETEDVAREDQILLEQALSQSENIVSETTANKLAEKLNTSIEVITDTSIIPQSQVKKRRAKGWYDPKTDKVWVVLPNHATVSDLQATILHEAVGHKGLRSLLGEQFNPTMNKVFTSLPNHTQADYLARFGDKAKAAEEYLSEMAESNIDPTLWNKIIGFIRDAFRSIGIDLRLSDADMRFLLWRSKNRLQKGNPTVLDRIQDVAESERMRTLLHGSPHKFNKFSLDYVGTGEGAQAYGWGLYFADLEEVAKSYVRTRSALRLEAQIENILFDIDEVKKFPTLYAQGELERLEAKVSQLQEESDRIQKSGRNLYKVKIHGDKTIDDLNFIRWDQPLGRTVSDKIKYLLYDVIINNDTEEFYNTDLAKKELKSEIESINGETLGADAYGTITDYLGNQKEASLFLLSNGFDGMKYPANFTSINPSETDFNYVIFDDNILEIEEHIMFRESFEDIGPESNTIELTRGQRWIEKLQDRMISGSVLLDEVRKRGGKVGVFSNFVSEETRSSSRAKAELDDFLDNYYKPITTQAGKWVSQGMTIEDIEDYMKAKHAPEVNKNITSREARQSVIYGIQKEVRKINEKKQTFKTEKAVARADEAIATLKKQMDFLNSKENRDVVEQIISNAYDVVFNRAEKIPVPLMSIMDMLFAVGMQKRLIQTFTAISNSENSNIRSGKSDQQANETVKEFESKIEAPEIAEFWNSVKRATRFSLDKSLKYGLISKEVYDRTVGMYEYYVPLRGWDVKEEVDYSDIFGENYLGYEILNPVNKQAKGRLSEAEGPLGYIGSMAETSIVAGNKNEVRKNAWRLIKNNENLSDLFLIKDTWLVNTAEIGEEPIWEQTYEAPTEEMIEAGMAKKAPLNTTYEWHKTRGEIAKHQVPVLIDGKRVIMEFKGKQLGPRVAAAINGDNVIRWKGTEGLGQFTRVMASLKTSKNPDFMLTNFTRDYFFGAMSYYIRGGNSVTLTKNIGRAWVAIHKDFTKGKEDPYLKQMYNDFKMNGGETGYVHMLGQPDFMKEANKLIKEASMAGKITPAMVAKKTGKVINHSLDYLANMSENAMRFAAYLTEAERMMKEQGLTEPTEAIKKQSALAAKELTTNFNRKGTWGSQANAMYAFLNASIQGTANYFKLAKENPVRFVKANLALLATRTLFQALCMLIAGDDDDDEYYALSDYIKENNFIIPAGNGQFITIPLPHGARAFTSIGPAALEVISGKKDADKAIADYLRNIVGEVSPINLVGLDKSAFLLPTTFAEGMLTITPTALRPLAEAGANIDFMANPIERTNFLATDNDYLPRYRNAYPNTNPILVGTAKFLNNNIGGGNDYRSAGVRIDKNGTPYRSKAWGALDMSPAYTEHIIEGYLGGAGRFVNDLFKTSRSIIQGEVPKKQNIPVLRRFLQEPYEKRAMQEYYETRSRVNDITKAKKAAKDTDNQSEFTTLNSAYNNELSLTFDTYNKEIRKWSKIKEQHLDDKKYRPLIEEHIQSLILDMNKKVKEIDKRYNKK